MMMMMISKRPCSISCGSVSDMNSANSDWFISIVSTIALLSRRVSLPNHTLKQNVHTFPISINDDDDDDDNNVNVTHNTNDDDVNDGSNINVNDVNDDNDDNDGNDTYQQITF